MIRKFKILLLIIFFAPSCGFTPIYSSKNISWHDIIATGEVDDIMPITNTYMKKQSDGIEERIAGNCAKDRAKYDDTLKDTAKKYYQCMWDQNKQPETVRYFKWR